MRRRESKDAGFTLIELAIVLVIISFMLGGIVAYGYGIVQQQRISNTQKYLRHVTEALGAYVEKYGHLPCPTDITLSVDDAAYGFGVGTGVDPNSVGGGCTENLIALRAGGVQVGYMGAVPYKILGVPYAVTEDGWGRRLVYAVDVNMTWEGALPDFADGFKDTRGQGVQVEPRLEVLRRSGIGVPVTDEAAFVLFSTGKNGAGGWGKSGIKIAATEDADEDINTKDDGFDNSHAFVQSFGEQNGDDYLVFRTRWLLPEPGGTNAN